MFASLPRQYASFQVVLLTSGICYHLCLSSCQTYRFQSDFPEVLTACLTLVWCLAHTFCVTQQNETNCVPHPNQFSPGLLVSVLWHCHTPIGAITLLLSVHLCLGSPALLMESTFQPLPDVKYGPLHPFSCQQAQTPPLGFSALTEISRKLIALPGLL